jgi:DNA replication and repair protein RecF
VRHVGQLTLRNFRNYEEADTSLASGITVVHGPVGAGKTNLLEAIYVGCVGRSFRTKNERDLVKFGAPAARVAVTSTNGVADKTILEVGLEPGRAKIVKIDGVPSERIGAIEGRPMLCVFMPDRLELVKGPAAVRRSHLDALVDALWPTRRSTRLAYARALAQRNALLGRLRARGGSVDSLSSWDRELALHGGDLMRDRSAALQQIASGFAEHGVALGLGDAAAIAYRPRSGALSAEELRAELAAHLQTDLERGYTTHGPHRDDFSLRSGSHDLRRFGSQGQQRIALLALLLAERDALEKVRGEIPILLLDDVLSELDVERRERLLDSVAQGQTLITTADPHSAGLSEAIGARLQVTAGQIDG